MLAVIKTGGKQYKVSEGMKLRVEKLEGEVGSALAFGEVLFVGDEKAVKVGAPFISGAKVEAKIIRQDRAKDWFSPPSPECGLLAGACVL